MVSRRRAWYRQGEALTEEIRNTATEEGALALWHLGQCGFVWKSGVKNRVTVYIDPVLNDLTDDEGVTRRHFPAPFSPDKAEGDYVLCTHWHGDHMALKTLAGMAEANENIKFIRLLCGGDGRRRHRKGADSDGQGESADRSAGPECIAHLSGSSGACFG